MSDTTVASINTGKPPRSSNASRRPRKSLTPRVVKFRNREYSQIEAALTEVKCTLTCASLALSQAQDTNDNDLGAKAWWVIHACVDKLERFQNDLESWHEAHEHSPKRVQHGE